MIERKDILSLEFLKKADSYTGCNSGLRYRLKKTETESGTVLQAAAWPEPYNFISTPEEQKEYEEFEFSEEGIQNAIDWLNRRI